MPAGTDFVTITMREALRDAMAEQMRRDKDVFVMGEEVAQQDLPPRDGIGEQNRHRAVFGFPGDGVEAHEEGEERDQVDRE